MQHKTEKKLRSILMLKINYIRGKLHFKNINIITWKNLSKQQNVTTYTFHVETCALHFHIKIHSLTRNNVGNGKKFNTQEHILKDQSFNLIF